MDDSGAQRACACYVLVALGDDAVGVQPAANPVERIMVNVGCARARRALVAAWDGPMPADARGAWWSPRSSPMTGKPSTWRRRTAGRQHEELFGRSGVDTLAPLDAKSASGRVLGWQTKLHRWTVQDEQGPGLAAACDPADRPRQPRANIFIRST